MAAAVDFGLTAVEYLSTRLPGHFLEDSRGVLVGSCLFHNDGLRPNLGVFESGAFKCLSCGESGDFVKLVQKIECLMSYGDACDWLNETFGVVEDAQPRQIQLKFGGVRKGTAAVVSSTWQPPPIEILEQYSQLHPYLADERGITEDTQKQFGIGYDRKRRAITFPWYDRHGTLMTVKFRPTWTKSFFYLPMGPGVKRSLLFGIHRIRGLRRVALVEAEIDALTVWQALGIAAVATGGAEFSDEQARELALTGVEEVVLMGDNDEAGRRLNGMVREKMRRHGVRALDVEWPTHVKDANQALTDGVIGEVRVIEARGLALGGRRGVA